MHAPSRTQRYSLTKGSVKEVVVEGDAPRQRGARIGSDPRTAL